MTKDFAIGTTNVVPAGAPISKKPSYLITLEEFNGLAKTYQRFIAVDRPDFSEGGFIHAKGFFTDMPEEEIINNISDILTSIKKELLLEMSFPNHRIFSIRSLVFNAVKTPTIVK